MTDIDMRCTPRVIIGPITRLNTGNTGQADRALLLADTVLESTASAVQEQLDARGINTILFAREGLSADTGTLDESLSLARGSHAGMIVSLGGEKILSLGRLVASAVLNGSSGGDILEQGSSGGEGLPVLEIPSSGRHSLLFRKEALLTDASSRRTSLIRLQNPAPETVLLDSSLTADLPPGSSALCAASVLGASVEAFLGGING